MDVYRIGVSILATNGVSPVLATIGSQMRGIHSQVLGIGSGIGGWGIALGAVGGVLAAGAIAKGLVVLARHGGDVNHQLELMKTAGMSVAETQASMSQAMKTSGNVLTTTLSENLKHIRELRYAFGETTTAIQHLDEISKANTILNNIRGGGKDEVWELVKALESKGETFDPKAFSSYVETMTKVVQATGGKVTPQMFMGTFKYGRTATLGWDESFIGGALPRLIQEYTSGNSGAGGTGGPGNALMSSYAKIVQEQMSKKSAAEFERMGLGKEVPIEGSSNSQLTGMIGRSLFLKNPYEWVQQVLLPKLAEHGVTSKEDVMTELSKMFQVRTASDIMAKMALQGRYMEGAQSPFEKDIALQKKPMGLPAYDELIKNDYPMVLEAFTKQWKNLLETLGTPLMAPGGPVISAMSALASAFGSIGQFAGAHISQVTAFFEVLGKIISVMATIDSAALSVISTVLFPAFHNFGKIPWDTISQGLSKCTTALSEFSAGIMAFVDKVTSIVSKILGLAGSLGRGPADKGFQKDLDDANKKYVPTNFNPGTNVLKAQPISLTLNMDGRTLAQAMSDQLDYLYEHATGAPSYDGSRRFIPSDGGMIGT